MAPAKRTQSLRAAKHRQTKATSSVSSRSTVIKQQDSPLLNLPSELHNNIYNLVLLCDGKLDFLSDNTVEVRKTKPARLSSLLDTCSQIREEARPIYNGGNTFHARVDVDERCGPYRAPNFINNLRQIGPRNCRVVSSMTLHFTNEYTEESEDGDEGYYLVDSAGRFATQLMKTGMRADAVTVVNVVTHCFLDDDEHEWLSFVEAKTEELAPESLSKKILIEKSHCWLCSR